MRRYQSNKTNYLKLVKKTDMMTHYHMKGGGLENCKEGDIVISKYTQERGTIYKIINIADGTKKYGISKNHGDVNLFVMVRSGNMEWVSETEWLAMTGANPLQTKKADGSLQQKEDSIVLLKNNEKLLNEYGVYKVGDEIPDLDVLQDMIKRITLIEDNKIILNKYGVYKAGDEIPELRILVKDLRFLELIKNNGDDENKTYDYDDVKKTYIAHMLNSYPELLDYNEYKVDHISPYEIQDDVRIIDLMREYPEFKDYMPYNKERNIRKLHPLIMEYYIENIELIRKNPILKEHHGYRKGDNIKPIERIKNDIKHIASIHDDCKTPEYPDSFNISGLVSFSVYKNTELNKIIYLLGEQHSMTGICDERYNAERPTYNADDFFFSLLNCFVPKNNKLDVFMELPYDPSSDVHKFTYLQSGNGSYMTRSYQRLYGQNCKPSYIKDIYHDNGICIHDGRVRFHHGDVRQIYHGFTKYISKCFRLLNHSYYYRGDKQHEIKKEINQFTEEFSSYDEDKLLSLFNSSPFISKTRKQIDSIIVERVRSFLLSQLEFFIIIVTNKIKYLTYGVVINEINKIARNKIIDPKIKLHVNRTYLKIMDLYLMSRVFRTFKTDPLSPDSTLYSASNIIIYAGNAHIDNYIMWLLKLGFENILTSKKSQRHSCIQVDGFKFENL
jgi:hypothetical protein